jgi:hypothetical protein
MLEQLELQARVVHFRELVAIELAIPEGAAMRSIVKTVRYVCQITGIQTGMLKAVSDCSYRKRTRRLFPHEPLLGHCEIDSTTPDQDRGGIKTLSDPIRSLLQLGETGLLEPNRVVEAADADDIHVSTRKCAREIL